MQFDELGAEIDGLVNCGAVFVPWATNSEVPRQDPEDLQYDLWQRILGVNLDGSFLCAQEAGKRMLAGQREGSIVNVSSIAGASGLGRGNIPYSAAKSAVHAVTRELAVEWGHQGIRVNAVIPGHIRTENLQNILDDHPDLAERMLDRAYAAIPMRRFGEPVDVAEAIVFLLSEAAAFINGVLLPVDGGNLAMNASGNSGSQST